MRRRKDGSCVPVSIARVPVSVPGGKIAEYGIYHDITKRKRTEEDLRASEERWAFGLRKLGCWHCPHGPGWFLCGDELGL